MGSGHFLTSAIDYLAREIIDAQEKQAAQQGIESVNKSHDINWARRKVAQRCIYGVDLNPLAVELSKVSLWLRTLAAEQPLAFLDHHLKTGNSLVGSDIETVLDNGDPNTGTTGGQLTLQESFNRTRQQALKHVTNQFKDLLTTDNETLSDIKDMEAVYEEVRDDLLYQRLIAMANVHTAEQSELDVPGDVYERMAEALRDDSWKDIEGKDWYRSAQTMAEDQRFFHWELEFPIAFYEQDGERKEDGGFDAVIGNPPYIRIQTISGGESTQAKYYKQQYDSAVGKYDIFVVFIEKGIELTCKDGRFGMIVPNKFIQSNYGSGIRKTLLKSDTLDRIVDFGDSQVFKGQSTYTSILLLSNNSEKSFRYSETTDERLEDLDFNPIAENTLSDDPWNIATGVEADVLNKLLGKPTNLGDISEEIFQGVITGGDDYFILEKAETTQRDDIQRVSQRDGDQVYEIESELLQPFVKGDGIRRFYAEERETYLLYPYDDENGDILSEDELKNQYPKGFKYLNDHLDGLGSRGSESMDYETWYALWNPRQPWKFDANKILTPVIAQSGRFCPDESGIYFNGSGGGGGGGYGVILEESTVVSERYVAAVLNSRVCDFIIRYTSSIFEGEFFAYNRQYIEPLPIPIDNAGNGINVDTPFEFDQQPISENVLESCASEYQSARSELYNLNLNILDYLQIPSDELSDSKAGETLGEMQTPVAGVADTPLVETTEEYEGLRIEDVSLAEDGGRVVLSVDISYKIEEEEDPRETDRWDRLAESEFETYEAMAFVGLSDAEETLLREFVPVAVEKAGGFTGFRQGATKTNSPLDRLKDLTLPDIDEVQTGLEQYIEVRERADELEEKIEKTDQLIDEIVYDLYGLTNEEIEIVESAVQDD
jgi:adenine-specific DNA methylase